MSEPEKIPVFTSLDDEVQWKRDWLRREGFHVFTDGAVHAHTAAFLLGRSVSTLANWRSARTGPRWRRRSQVIYMLPDLIEFDRNASSRVA